MKTPSSPVTSRPPAPSQTLPAGLTSAEVAERIQRGETNNYRARVGRSYWDIFRDNILNLFNFIFGVLLFVVLLFQDYTTVFFAGFSVVTNSMLGMVQEVLAKRKLDQLAMLSLAKVRVYRDGELRILSTLEVVKDDVIPLEPGDRIVVDGQMVTSDALEVDESQLTGESDAVLKDEGDKVSSGSYCIAGSGVMIATAVGVNSTINKLQDVAKEYKRVLTPTQRRIALIVQLSVVLMLVMTPMIFAAGFLTHNRVIELETFRSAVVFVASLVPQGLVLTATLALTIGAINISMKQTLVQRVNAVESMSNVTTLCFDKTGTLTLNHLSVVEIIPLGGGDTATLDKKLRLYTSNLSNLNTTAAAIADYLKTDDAPPQAIKQREIPFTSTRKWSAVVFNDETLVLGAPERVLPADAHDAFDRAQALSAEGLRVLAFAQIDTALVDGVLDDRRQGIALIVLSDELRPDIQETLNSFVEQNVALKVITGDNLDTARHIATTAGMVITEAHTGDQIEAMNDAQLERAVATANLFARIDQRRSGASSRRSRSGENTWRWSVMASMMCQR